MPIGRAAGSKVTVGAWALDRASAILEVSNSERIRSVVDSSVWVGVSVAAIGR